MVDAFGAEVLVINLTPVATAIQSTELKQDSLVLVAMYPQDRGILRINTSTGGSDQSGVDDK